MRQGPGWSATREQNIAKICQAAALAEQMDMMEKQATRFGLVNYSVMYKKDDDMLKQLYEKKGYKFIPRYDGVDTQDCCGDIHIKVFKVIISEYRIPTAITGGDEVPNLLLLR